MTLDVSYISVDGGGTGSGTLGRRWSQGSSVTFGSARSDIELDDSSSKRSSRNWLRSPACRLLKGRSMPPRHCAQLFGTLGSKANIFRCLTQDEYREARKVTILRRSFMQT
ncbi:unnamed protein product [Polarella glacialis]|uniref:Uncharacterized protein n=1 Tax=Polarella glacialis TaxID=89957 RepID=A0A813K526_POLGL|nr:unnamed protein product [Polarella glacialis]CAE8691622.1 unnamed protein product [Polarella glacialis]